MNYFSLFGLPDYYQVDIQQLSSIFQNLQRQYHPDKFIKDTQEKQMIALEQSAVINQAWQTLRNPLSRAEHLLSINGFNLEKNQKQICDTEFLMEQLELREELEDIDRAKDEKRLKIFMERINGMFNVRHAQMVEQLNNKQWNLAINTIQKLYFFEKLLSCIKQLEEKFFNFQFRGHYGATNTD